MTIRRFLGIISGHFPELFALNLLMVLSLLPVTAIIIVFIETSTAAAAFLAGPACFIVGAVCPSVITVLTTFVDGHVVYLWKDMLASFKTGWLRGGVTGCIAGWSAVSAILIINLPTGLQFWGVLFSLWFCYIAVGLYTSLYYQYARINAPLKFQLRNSLMLPFACGIRGIAAVFLETVFVFTFPLPVLLPVWLLGIPILYQLLIAALFWPPMRQLYNGGTPAPGSSD